MSGKAFWEEVRPSDPDFAAAYPHALDEAKSEANAMKKTGKRWGSGREKLEWMRRRAMVLAVEMVLAARRGGIADKHEADSKKVPS